MYGQSTGLIIQVVAINLFGNCSTNMYTIGVAVHIVGTQMHMTGLYTINTIYIHTYLISTL